MSPVNEWVDGMRERLSGLHRKPTVWLVIALLVMSALGGVSAWRASHDRGLMEPSLWLVEASEQRVDFYRAWRKGEKEAKTRSFIKQTFDPHGAVPPLVPAVTATVRGAGVETPIPRIAAAVNAALMALFVLLMGLMGREVGGGVGAMTAAAGALAIPRLFGLGAMVGFGMAALLFLTATPWLMVMARRYRWATVAAIFGIAASLHSSMLGLFVWFPWIYMALTRARVTTLDDGAVATPPVPLRNILIVPLGLALGFWLYPYMWVDLKEHSIIWLTHFMRVPAEPFSYMGEIWGHERIPWHAAPFMIAVTVPPAFLILALGGMRFGPWYERLSKLRPLGWLEYLPLRPETPSDRAAARNTPAPAGAMREPTLRLARVMLVLTLALPLLLRSPYFGGIDLLALTVPWVLVFAAAGAQRLVWVLLDALPWRAADDASSAGLTWLRTSVISAVFALLLVPPALDLARYHPLEEAYYSWLVGGPEGARLRGLPRYPHAPLPNTLVRELIRESGTPAVQVGFLLPGDAYDRAFMRAIHDGILPPGPTLTPRIYDADIAVLPHDDLHPEYETAATDFYRTIEGEPKFDVVIYSRGAVPIFSAALAPRVER